MRKRFLPFLLLVSFIAYGTPARAQDMDGMKVSMAIEGCDRRVAEGTVNAYTFDEALKALASQNDLRVVFSHDGKKIRVYAINGAAENTFSQSDGWFGYVLRRGGVIKPADYLKLLLEDGDELVLYYGDAYDTKIVSSFTLAAEDSGVTFVAETQQSRWTRRDGRWTQETFIEGLKDLKIRIRQPDGNLKILKTNENGVAGTSLGGLGVYEYFAEGYASGSYPLAVRTNDFLYLHGVANEACVTRGEAVAFVVNHFIPKSGGYQPQINARFTDVSGSTRNAEEIVRGAEAGLVSGFEDGGFMPDEPATLLHFALMLGGIFPADSEPHTVVGAPEWAEPRLGGVLAGGLLDDVDKDWDAFVTADVLTQVYLNAKEL